MAVLMMSPGLCLAQQLPAATSPIGLAMTGRIEKPRSLVLADLTALPPVTVEVTRAGGQGPQQKTAYTGALLWTLVEGAEPVDEAGEHSRLRHTLLARGRDGYAVALAIGELDPGFEGKQVLVPYAQDGKPLAALRLVVPGDARGGRGVRDLVADEVR